jgi:hypothetical protein
MERIPLDEMDAIPGAKFKHIGDSLSMMIVTTEVIPWIEYGKDTPKMGADGRPRTQERITGFVTGGNALCGKDDTPVVVGQLVSVYAKAQARWDLIEARKDAQKDAGRKMSVGDFLSVTFQEEVPAKEKSANKRKVYKYQFSENADERTIAVCTAKYWELNKKAPATVSATDNDEDYDPFPD